MLVASKIQSALPSKCHLSETRQIRHNGHTRTPAPQQDTHSADYVIGAREHHRACRILLFDSNCAALHSADFVNDITCPTGDRM
jgi:hypothetical protein